MGVSFGPPPQNEGAALPRTSLSSTAYGLKLKILVEGYQH